MNTLLLFTENYPFFPGEEFLETEIHFLCNAFEQVDIIPTGQSGYGHFGRNPIRALPKNATLRSDIAFCIAQKRKKPRLLRLLYGLSSRLGWKLWRQEIVVALRYGYKGVKRLLQKISDTVIISRSVEHVLKTSKAYWFSRDKKPAVLYAYWLNEIGLAVSVLGQKYGVKTVIRTHGADLYRERHKPAYLPLQRLTVEQASIVCPISTHGLKRLQQSYPQCSEKFLLQRLAVKQALVFSRASEDGVLRIVSCSRLVAVKQIHLLIKALKELSVTVEWTHIGDGPLRKSLMKACKSLPANVHYKFLGQLSNTQVLAYYADHPVDIFVNVSEFEGVPLTLMEALSKGIPVVAPNIGGISELLKPEVGVLMPAALTPQIISEAILHLHELEPAAKIQMRQQAIKRWQEFANADTIYPEFAAMLLRE